MRRRIVGLLCGLGAAFLAAAGAARAEDPDDLIARITGLEFASTFSVDLLGAPGAAQIIPPTPEEAALGLAGRVRFPLGDPARARALTFLVFESFDRARRAVRDRAFLAAELLPPGVAAADVDDVHVNAEDFFSRRIEGVSCYGGPTDRHFRVRCHHLEKDSPVLVVAESLAGDRSVTRLPLPIQSGDGDPLISLIVDARIALAGGAVVFPAPIEPVMALDLTGRRTYLAYLGEPDTPHFDPRVDLRYGDHGFLGVVTRPFLARIHGSMPRGTTLETGLEFWVFTDAAAAEEADFQDDFYLETLTAPGGLGAVEYIDLTGGKGAETVTLSSVACAALDVPATLSHQIRCEYRLPESNVMVVAYSYNAPAGFPEVAAEVRQDVANALFGGLAALSDAGIGVLNYAAAPPSTPPSTPPPSAPGPVEAGLTGTWETDIPAPGGGGWDRWRLEIAAGGTYTFLVNGAFVHRGRFEAANGLWTLVSETNDWTDGGSFALPGPGFLALSGRLGVSNWRRPGP